MHEPDDVDERTARLQQLLADNADQLSSLERQHAEVVAASVDSNADDEHDPEGATIAFERQQVAALLTAARQRLADVDAALTRRAEGGYGVCQDCGRPIAPERLAARPAARTCIACAR